MPLSVAVPAFSVYFPEDRRGTTGDRLGQGRIDARGQRETDGGFGGMIELIPQGSEGRV